MCMNHIAPAGGGAETDWPMLRQPSGPWQQAICLSPGPGIWLAGKGGSGVRHESTEGCVVAVRERGTCARRWYCDSARHASTQKSPALGEAISMMFWFLFYGKAGLAVRH